MKSEINILKVQGNFIFSGPQKKKEEIELKSALRKPVEWHMACAEAPDATTKIISSLACNPAPAVLTYGL